MADDITTDDGHDYAAFQKKPTGDAFQQLWQLVHEEERADREVDRAEAALKVAKERLKDLQEKQIPELMEAMGQESCKTSDGLKVSVRHKIRASIAKDPDKKSAALGWLATNGHGSIIKTEVSAKFDRGQEEAAVKAIEALRAAGVLGAEMTRDVANNTLCAFIAEALEKGINVPMELFSAFKYRVADIKRPEAK